MAKTLDAAGVKRLIQEIKGANKNLNTPIPISTENTTESMSQNVKNIADYVEKAKAAGVDTTKSFRITLEIDGYPVEGSYDIQYSYACGLQITDDGYALLYNIDVTTGEVFPPCEIVTARSIQKVTSNMLDKGARKPIILTPSTTEVDEETYQKLLSNDVDVVFNMDDGSPLYLNFKESSGDGISLWFGYIATAPISAEFPYGYSVIVQITVTISSATPHKLVLSEPSEVAYKPDEFIVKSDFIPVLQEINLTGTDAERKAKLDQFEADWKALTGASDLTGARFVGRNSVPDDGTVITGVLSYDDGGYYVGLLYAGGYTPYKAELTTDGSLTITPLFSHLEAITIKTGNSPDDKAANVAAIKAYVDNLTALGVDVTKGYMIPCKLPGSVGGVLFAVSNNLMVAITTNERRELNCYEVYIGGNDIGRIYWTGGFQLKISSDLTTTSKQIVGAINEINANAVHKDKFVPTLEAITIGDNTPEGKAATKAAIEAYRDNLTALGVDVTKGFMIPIKTNTGNGFILFDGTKGDGYVKLYNDCYGISISANYGVTTTTLMSVLSTYNALETTSKRIIPAINEVNALAKGYSTIFTPIELTTETAQNKTAIDARVAAFTAQGISPTNGCCIPVTYKGVYAGNISLINGDWYGLLVKNTNNPADNINIKLSADGTITEGNSAQ